MGKSLKILGWLIAVLAVLIVVAVVVLPQVISPNDYKPEIIAKVKQETGRDLTIDGDIGLSVFPWLGFETGSMSISNPANLDGGVFASVEQAAIRIKLLPLLQKRFEVDKVGLTGLRLNLLRREDGANNWDDLGTGKPATTGKQGAAKPTAKGAALGLENYSVQGVDISDARIVWDDRQAGQYLSVDELDVRSGPVLPGQPVELEIGMVVDSREPPIQSDIRLQAVVGIDEAAGMILADRLHLVLQAKGTAVPGGAVQADLEANVKIALDGGLLEVSDVVLKSDNFQLTANVHGRDLQGTPVLNGNVEIAEFNLKDWLAAHQVSPRMSDPNALTRVAAKTQVMAQGGTVALEALAVDLDDSKLAGVLNVKGSAVDFKLTLDEINMDRYLPPQEKAPTEGAASGADGSGQSPTEGRAHEEPLFPVEVLRELNLNGELDIGKLVLHNLKAEKVALSVKAAGGRLDLEQQIGGFYRGRYQGKVGLDVRGKSPTTRITAASSGIQIGPMLKDMVGEERLTGRGGFNADLSSNGNSLDALKRGLSGKVDFSFIEGALKGVNIARLLRETRARFSGQPLPPNNEPLQTDFSEVTGSGVIAGGVLENRDLLAKSPFLRVTGAGKANLVSETLDYTVQAVVVGTDKGQGEGLEDLKGVNIPIHLTGPIASPDHQIDWGKILLETQKAKIKEKLQEKLDEELSPELKGKIEKSLPPDLQNKLKGLFN